MLGGRVMGSPGGEVPIPGEDVAPKGFFEDTCACTASLRISQYSTQEHRRQRTFLAICCVDVAV